MSISNKTSVRFWWPVIAALLLFVSSWALTKTNAVAAAICLLVALLICAGGMWWQLRASPLRVLIFVIYLLALASFAFHRIGYLFDRSL